MSGRRIALFPSWRHIGVAMLAVLAGAGCLGPGTTAQLRYYALDPIDVPRQPAAASGKRVGVMPVHLPGYLDRPDLVERRGMEVVPHRSSAWAAPLDAEFARVLAENLQRSKPGYDVAVFPWRRGFTPDHRLAVDVVRFEIEAGAAVLHARWRLLGANGDGAAEGAESRIRVPVTGAGDDAWVAALSTALGRLSAAIAAAVEP